MPAALLILCAAYLGCGLIFAVAFTLKGAGRTNPHATNGSWGFRLLILPGAAALWPCLLRTWLKGQTEPKEQRDPHRDAAHKRKK